MTLRNKHENKNDDTCMWGKKSIFEQPGVELGDKVKEARPKWFGHRGRVNKNGLERSLIRAE